MTAMDSKMSPDFLPITTSVKTAGKVMASTATKTDAFFGGGQYVIAMYQNLYLDGAPVIIGSDTV